MDLYTIDSDKGIQLSDIIDDPVEEEEPTTNNPCNRNNRFQEEVTFEEEVPF